MIFLEDSVLSGPVFFCNFQTKSQTLSITYGNTHDIPILPISSLSSLSAVPFEYPEFSKHPLLSLINFIAICLFSQHWILYPHPVRIVSSNYIVSCTIFVFVSTYYTDL